MLDQLNHSVVAARVDSAHTPVSARLHPVAAHVYELCIAHAYNRPNVATIARMMKASPRSLERAFLSAALPPPRRLVTLARWIPVAEDLRVGEQSTRQLCRRLGFSSLPSLYRAAQREIHRTVSDLRRTGAEHLRRDLITAYQGYVTDACDTVASVAANQFAVEPGKIEVQAG